MNKNVLFSILILAIAASGIILLFNNKGADSNEENDQSGEIADISSDIVWDAYSLNGAPFIYPSTWTFAEVKDSTDEKKIIGFTITEPTSLDPRDKIEVGGKCPEVTIPEMRSACINEIWLHTESENAVVIGVFSDMKKFGENAIQTP